MDFIMQATVRRMRREVDVSIFKTSERIAETADDQERASEIFKTLTALHALKKQIDDLPICKSILGT
jgi:translation elongation factor EF-Ts